MLQVLLKLFLLAAVSAVAIEAASVPLPKKNGNSLEREGFKLLGVIRKPRTVIKYGVESTIYEDFYYWDSVNAAGWADAKKDCEANGDTLLYMETREEVANVTRFLQDTDATGSLYWTGGRYDVRGEEFIWDNGVKISPDAPWGANQPSQSKPNSRVAADVVGREIALKAQAATAATRYICESERPEDGDAEQFPEPCYKDNDLIIVVDSSGSIGVPHYEVAKEFTTRLATTWVDHIGSRVSVQIFASDARSIFTLLDDQTVDVMKDKIYNMPYLSGGTASDLGINLAVSELQANARSVVQNMVFLTDGASNSPAATKEAADKANALGIRTYSVGIGTNIGQAELLNIAGGNGDRVFSTDEFEELLALLRPLSRKVCE